MLDYLSNTVQFARDFPRQVGLLEGAVKKSIEWVKSHKMLKPFIIFIPVMFFFLLNNSGDNF
jgi:pantoate kinase